MTNVEIIIAFPRSLASKFLWSNVFIEQQIDGHNPFHRAVIRDNIYPGLYENAFLDNYSWHHAADYWSDQGAEGRAFSEM